MQNQVINPGQHVAVAVSEFRLGQRVAKSVLLDVYNEAIA